MHLHLLLPPLDHTQNDNLNIIQATISAVGLLVIGFLIAITLVNPRLRRTPLFLFVYLGTTMVCIGFAYPMITGWRYTMR